MGYYLDLPRAADNARIRANQNTLTSVRIRRSGSYLDNLRFAYIAQNAAPRLDLLSGRLGTFYGGAEFGTGFARFDGVDDYLEFDDRPALNIDQVYTILMKVRPRTSSPGFSGIIRKALATDNTGGWQGNYMIQFANSLTLQCAAKTIGGSNNDFINSAIPLTLNKWSFVVSGHSVPDNQKRCIVDGNIATGTLSAGTTALQTNNDPLWLGRRYGNYANIDIAYAFIISRYISHAEAIFLAENPQLLLEPILPLSVFISSGGGGSPPTLQLSAFAA